MPKTSKKLWKEESKSRKKEEAERDRLIKLMGHHPGVTIITDGPMPPGLEGVVEQLRTPLPSPAG